MRSFRIIYIIAILFLGACSEPEVVIPPFEIPTTGQHVLIEELTGVRCPNCPSAAARLESIKLLYGDNIILVNIHGDLLTKPLPESKFDFRNPDASALEEYFKPFIGKPSVIINRKIHPEFELLANPLQDQWQTIVENELQEPQKLSIVASTESRVDGIALNIGVIPVISLIGKHFLHVYVIENHILDVQEDVDRIIPDYEHNHVLRKIVTPFEGKLIGSLENPDQIVNEDIFLPNTDLGQEWNVDNLELVVFISDESGGVLQTILTHYD